MTRNGGNATGAETTVACHVRAPMLIEPIDSHVETLRACEQEGAIDSLVLRSWPDKVALTESSPFQEAVEAFERFERWAEGRGVSVRPPFEVRSVESRISDTEREVLSTPLIAVAVYRDEHLTGVYPHTDGDETYTVADAIAKLRTGEAPTPFGDDLTPTPVDAAGCPDCGGDLVDGQGLFGCVDCEWVGVARGDGRLVPAAREAPADGGAPVIARR